VDVVSDGPSGPPEVMKRRVRNILRQERERKDISRKEAADSVEWSESKLSRIETGVTIPAPADVRFLLMQYGVDEARIVEVIEIARAARQPDEWESYRTIYSPAAINLFASERSAALVMKFEPSLIPGLFQTEDYTRALLRETRSDPNTIDDKVKGRLLRQEMLEGDECPELDFIIGEAAVSRPIGGIKVMRAQIDKLKDISTHKKVTLRIIPFSVGAHPGLGSAFTVLEFRDPDLQDLVYLENAERESIVRDDQAEVKRFAQRFAELAEIASPADELGTILDEIAKARLRKI